MAQQGRLRVAVEDRPDALELVRAEVYAATGLTAEPEFQEIDCSRELLVELRLPDTGGHSPTEVATMIAAEAPRLEVLSAWSEPPGPVLRRIVTCQVVDLLQCEVSELAFRAHRDGLPTARWHCSSRTGTPHWLLAVPAIRADRTAVVGLCRRTGYHYRFSASEARSLELAAA